MESKRVLKRTVVTPGGLESLVDFTAYALLFIGIAVSFLPLLTFSLAGLFGCLLGIFLSFVQWLLFRSIAEILRLLKMQNGLNYRGRITTTEVTEIFACENCGMVLHSDDRCESCGARITGTAVESPENHA